MVIDSYISQLSFEANKNRELLLSASYVYRIELRHLHWLSHLIQHICAESTLFEDEETELQKPKVKQSTSGRV